MKKKLRIGILLDNDLVHAWIYEMLSHIHSIPNTEIVVSIQEKEKIRSGRRYYLYDLYTKLDRTYFKSNHDAFELKSLKSLLKVATVTIDEKQKIKNFDLDLIIQLKQNEQPDKLLNAARYGVWYFHFGDCIKTEDTPDIFWEVIERKGEVGLTLVMKKTKEEFILATSYSLTDNLSVERTKNAYCWKAASLMPNTIHQLMNLGTTAFFEKSHKLNEQATFFSNRVKSIPTNSRVLLKLAKFKWKRFSNIISSFFYFDQLILLFNFEEKKKEIEDFSKFKKIIPPKDRFWADPHIIKKNGKYYIFIEELIFSQNKGFISVIEMDNKGNYKPPVVILDKAYHLSFPFVFEDDGNIFMIPESKQNNNVQCIEFPFKWKLETVLMEKVKAVDTVVIKKDGLYWLFTNMVRNNGASLYDELHLFSSESLVSDTWKSHPENPIVSDVKNARMAGKIFEINGNLYRPSQNCSNHYGYGMHINRIIELTKTRYLEETVTPLNPNWEKHIVSTHSLAVSPGLSVIDAQLKRRK